MEGSIEHHNDGDYIQQELTGARGKYRILFVVKFLLGILLLVLGGMAANYTSGQKRTFGPPYFLGAFIVGCAERFKTILLVQMIVAGVMNIFIYRNSNLSDSATVQKLSKYTCFEILLTNIAIVGGFIGIFFVCIFGIPECDPSDFSSHCNYTKNLSTNRNLAIAILISLLLSIITGVVSIVKNCRICKGHGSFKMRKGKKLRFRTRRQDIYVARSRGGGNVVIIAPQPSPYARGFGRNRSYDSYSADTQYISDDNVIDKTPGGFSGAVIQPPQATVIHPPVGYSQYPGATSQGTPYRNEGQGNASDGTVNHLQEQNRLLREQIALQQQQLQLMQQQQQQQQQDATSSSPLPPPPSYESCMQNPAQIKFLQEQNKELQSRYQKQQHQITEKIPFTDVRNTTPSAPPM